VFLLFFFVFLRPLQTMSATTSVTPAVASSVPAVDLFVEVAIAPVGAGAASSASSMAALVAANRTNDIVFVCGNNSHGECGVGNQRKVQTPMPLRLAMGRKC
jgi:hypothetical protein